MKKEVLKRRFEQWIVAARPCRDVRAGQKEKYNI
jgi:hypothetical protein